MRPQLREMGSILVPALMIAAGVRLFLDSFSFALMPYGPDGTGPPCRTGLEVAIGVEGNWLRGIECISLPVLLAGAVVLHLRIHPRGGRLGILAMAGLGAVTALAWI